jgi:hypothetical protein
VQGVDFKTAKKAKSSKTRARMSPVFLDATEPPPRRITTLTFPTFPRLRQPHTIDPIHTMSAPSAIELPAIKARGRPRKTPASEASASSPTKSSARHASTRSASAKKTIDAQKEKKRILTKTATYKATKNAPPAPPTPTPTSIPASASAAAAASATQTQTQTSPLQQPTPATPTTSKIIDEVRATGTFKARTFKAPIDLPPSPSPSSSSAPTHPNTNTIPLPRKPSAGSPPSQSSAPGGRSPLAFARPAAPGRARAQQQTQRYRVVEPTPNVELPSKYKPAMRRVTTILVGIPIILVVGYELYNRARAEIRTKWDDGERKKL